MTIPKGTLFPMCGMNLAFNRELIGPAMYFGLMGDGQPIGRYDDMWAGWCVKVLYSKLVLNFLTLSKTLLDSLKALRIHDPNLSLNGTNLSLYSIICVST